MVFLTLVINLKDSSSRLESVSSMLNNEGVDWEVVEAIDGRRGDPDGDYKYDERLATIRHDRPMSSGEKGCFLSQSKALRYFLASNSQYLILFEDDVAIPQGTISKLKRIATSLDDYTNSDWDTFNFGQSVRGFQFPAFELDGVSIHHSFYPPCGLPGQMWTRQGAACFLNSRYGETLMGPVDREMRSFFARRGKSFIPFAPMTSRVTFDSEIDLYTDRWLKNGKPYKTSLRCKIMRHFPDYLYASANMLRTKLKRSQNARPDL